MAPNGMEILKNGTFQEMNWTLFEYTISSD